MNSSSKASILQDLKPHLPNFHKIASDAWEDYQNLSDKALIVFTPRTRASAVHDFMVARAAAYCEQCNDITQFEAAGMKGILVNDQYAIRFKKLDNSGLSKNQPTLQVAQFRSQENLDGLPHAVHLELGYITNQFQTQVSEIRLVCPSGREANAWEIAISESAIENVVENLFDNNKTDVEGETKVTPRQDKKQDGKVVNLRNIRNAD